MILLIKFAVRNVLRNKRRTLLTTTSIFISTFVITFGIGFFNGMIEGILRNYINYTTGNYKVTTDDYVRYERFMPVYDYIKGSKSLAERIREIPGISSVEERVEFGTVLGRGDRTEPARCIGVALDSGKFDLKNKLIKGKMEGQGLYISERLALKMKIGTGEDILLVAQTTERGLNGVKLNVKGIFSFGIDTFDKNTIFIDLRNARKLLRMNDGITEILIFTGKNAESMNLEKKIQDVLPMGTTLRNPSVQTEGVYDLMKNILYFFYVLMVLIMLLASFVIVNTMVMNLYERIKEIGALKALGMTDFEIFMNFTLEGLFIGSLGGISGGIPGYLLTIFTSLKGINFTSMVQNKSFPINNIIYPSADIQVFIISVLITAVISAFSAAIPAGRARKMSPADALREL